MTMTTKEVMEKVAEWDGLSTTDGFEANEEALELAGIESEPRMYSFSDFCLDNEVLSKEATDDLRHLRAMWDVCGDYYIAFCETNELEYEVIV